MHKAYELIKEEELGSLQAKGYVLRHKKSGAHVALIKNDDDNKVFYIGCRRRIPRECLISLSIRCCAAPTNIR